MKLENGVWTGTANLPSYFYGNFGSTEINLVVKCKPEAKSPCEKATKTEEKTLTDVQRAFSAGPDGSNRIIAAKVFEPGADQPGPGETGANAFEICEPKPTANRAPTNSPSRSNSRAALRTRKNTSAPTTTKSAMQPIPPFRVTYADNDQEDDDQFVLSCPPTTAQSGAATAYQEASGARLRRQIQRQHARRLLHGRKRSAEQKSKPKKKPSRKRAKKEEATKKSRETKEAEERAKWATEEKETKLTKAQREAKEKEQTNGKDRGRRNKRSRRTQNLGSRRKSQTGQNHEKTARRKRSAQTTARKARERKKPTNARNGSRKKKKQS